MEQNLWLVAHHFSFWYWKLGGTVKKSTLYIKEGLFWLCHLHHQHFPFSISSSNFHPILYLPVGELELPNSPWLSIPSIGHLNKRIRWPCFKQIYLAQIYLTLFCPNVFCSNIFWPNPFCSNIFCLNIFCSNIFCPNIFDPVLPKYIKTYHPYPCEKNAYTKKYFLYHHHCCVIFLCSGHWGLWKLYVSVIVRIYCFPIIATRSGQS